MGNTNKSRLNISWDSWGHRLQPCNMHTSMGEGPPLIHEVTLQYENDLATIMDDAQNER